MQNMKSLDKIEIRKKIEEEIASSIRTIKKYKDLTKPIAPENSIGRVSRMDAINNKSVNEAALKNAEIKLNNLQIALENMDDERFGICAKCHNSIPLGRILLVPQNRFCVNCAV